MKKICTKCKELKDLSEFYKRKNSIDGYRSACKECTLSTCSDYTKNNKKQVAKTKKEYHQNNRKKILEYQAKYRLENKDKCNAAVMNHYYNNKEKINKYRQQYLKANKDMISTKNKEYYKLNKSLIAHKTKKYKNSKASYEVYKDELTVDESPRLAKDNKSLETKCKYCNQYFIPSTSQARRRVQALKGQTEGDCSLYCSQGCKESCPIYGQILYPKGFKPASSREVNPLVRQMCFERDNWRCQICGATQKEAPLHCHHIEGYAQNPRLGNDVANTITLCKTCHKEVHKLPGCNYHELQCIRD